MQIGSVVAELLDRGILEAGECLSAGFSAEHLTGRNRLILIRTPTRTLSVKWHREPTAAAREVTALTVIGSCRPDFHVQSLVDHRADRVVLASSPGLRPVHERWRGAGPSRRRAHRLGRALASLHAVPPPEGTPWSRMPFDPSSAGEELIDASSGTREAVRRIQDDERVIDQVRELDVVLRSEGATFCHGDLRTHNVLGSSGADAALTLIDWETACAGPRSFDLGAGLAMFIEFALVAGKGAPDPVVLGAFLAGYADRAGGPVDLAVPLRCAGVRLLQTAVEYAAGTSEELEIVERFCRIGSMLLRRPGEGAVHLRLVA